MSQTVEIPDQGVAEFPDDFTPDQIKGVIQQKFYTTPTPAAPVQEEASIPTKIGRAVVETLKGFVPQSFEEAALAPVKMVPGVGKVGTILSNVAFGKPIAEGLDPLAGIPVAQRIPQIAAAEQTPAGSQERYTAGIGTLADVAMLAGFKGAFREAPKLAEIVKGKAEPATPMEAAVEPVSTEPIVTPPNEPTGIAQPQIEPSGLYTEGQKLGAQFEDLRTQAADIQERINVQRETQPIPEAVAPVTAEPIQQPSAVLGKQEPVAETTAVGTGKVPAERPIGTTAFELLNEMDKASERGDPVAVHMLKRTIERLPAAEREAGVDLRLSEREIKPTEEVTPSASQEPIATSATQPEVRTQVGEETPLRQQGETPATQEVAPTEEVATTVPQPEPHPFISYLNDIVNGRPVTVYHGTATKGLGELHERARVTLSQTLARKFAGKEGTVYEGKKIIPKNNQSRYTAELLLDDIKLGKISPDAAQKEFKSRVSQIDPVEGESKLKVKPSPSEVAQPEQIPAEATPVLEVTEPTTAAPLPETETPVTPQKPSKIGQSIEAKAVEAKLTQGFTETAGYDPISIGEQSQMATDFVRDNLPLSRAVVRGEAPLPPKLKGISLLTAMEEHLVRNPDPKVAYELANSPLTSATSAAAQELRLMRERVPDGPAAAFQEIREARRAGPKLRGETMETVARDITKEVVKAASKRPTWEAFVREIVCT